MTTVHKLNKEEPSVNFVTVIFVRRRKSLLYFQGLPYVDFHFVHPESIRIQIGRSVTV